MHTRRGCLHYVLRPPLPCHKISPSVSPPTHAHGRKAPARASVRAGRRRRGGARLTTGSFRYCLTSFFTHLGTVAEKSIVWRSCRLQQGGPRPRVLQPNRPAHAVQAAHAHARERRRAGCSCGRAGGRAVQGRRPFGRPRQPPTCGTFSRMVSTSFSKPTLSIWSASSKTTNRTCGRG